MKVAKASSGERNTTVAVGREATVWDGTELRNNSALMRSEWKGAIAQARVKVLGDIAAHTATEERHYRKA